MKKIKINSIEYDWLLHQQEKFAGVIKMELEAQRKERMAVKRYPECLNCFIIIPASKELIKANPL